MNFVHRKPLPRAAFFSLKASGPITCVGPLSEAFLIQATLDPAIERIGYCETLMLGGRNLRIEAPVLYRDDRAVVALIDEHNPHRDPDAESVAAALAAHSLRAQVFSAAEVLREPLATTARVVWRQRHVPVDLSMRLAFSHAFAEENVMTLDELCRRVPGPQDPVFQIMALCCEGLLRIDFSEGFNGDTIVRGPR